jgi:hypothetical protein
MKRIKAHQRVIENLHANICDEIMAFQDRTESVLMDAIERSGLEISECRRCSMLVVCIPDGLSNFCEKCAEKENK